MAEVTDTEVKAGVIGVGSMGRHHARVYSELQNVDLVGVFDIDEEQATDVATTHGSRPMDIDALLESVDIASVAVPTPFHYENVRKCIDHGVNVLVEKPFVEDPARGEDLIDRARDAGVVLQVGHIERFNPAVMTLADIIDGLDVIAIDAHRLGPPPERTIEDSAVLDLMIHDIDVLLSLVDDEVETVSAMGARNNRYATAQIEFEEGIVGSLTASRLTQQKVRTLNVTASDCRVNVDYTNQSIQIHSRSVPEYIESNGDLRYRYESIIEQPTVEQGEPLKNELASFVDSSITGNTPRVTGEDGIRVLKLARRIDELASGNRPTIEVGPQ